MEKIEYLYDDNIYEDYTELDEYLETRFIPNYVLLKKRKNSNGEIEYFPSIRLYNIMALKLSEAELEHVMNYLKQKNIRVGGKDATFDNEFDNYDYISTYKKSALPLNLSRDETLQKIRLYKQNNDQKLREEIITYNMRLVPYVAYRYAISTGINQEELESYGYEGLILALEKFDINSGKNFDFFAIANIRYNILYGIEELLIGKRDNTYFELLKIKKEIEKKHGVTLEEEPKLIEEMINLLVEKGKIRSGYWENNREDELYYRRMINSMIIGNLSLDDEEVVEDLLASEQLIDTHDYTEKILNSFAREPLEKMLDTLTDREAEILRLRFGFDDGIPKTLDKVAEILNLNRGRVQQIEHKAIRKLRAPDRAKNLIDFYIDGETEIYKNGR